MVIPAVLSPLYFNEHCSSDQNCSPLQSIFLLLVSFAVKDVSMVKYVFISYFLVEKTLEICKHSMNQLFPQNMF